MENKKDLLDELSQKTMPAYEMRMHKHKMHRIRILISIIFFSVVLIYFIYAHTFYYYRNNQGEYDRYHLCLIDDICWSNASFIDELPQLNLENVRYDSLNSNIFFTSDHTCEIYYQFFYHGKFVYDSELAGEWRTTFFGWEVISDIEADDSFVKKLKIRKTSSDENGPRIISSNPYISGKGYVLYNEE